MGLATHPGIKTICLESGKDIFTKSEAKSLAKRVQRQRGQLIDAYCCRHCKGWHIGNRPQTKRRNTA